MRDDTPYLDRPERERNQEQECMRFVFQYAREVTGIFEAFGGIGDTAVIMRERFPDVPIAAFDTNGDCVNTYNKRGIPKARCTQDDAMNQYLPITNRENQWGYSLDFNRFSLLDITTNRAPNKFNFVQDVFQTHPVWVQITDSSVRYFGTNWHYYGLGKKDYNLYIQEFERAVKSRWGYSLVTWRGYFAASYLLFGRR